MNTFPIDLVRREFPALNHTAVFLDNPAGTQVPRPVIEAVAGAMAGAMSNLNGYFQASREAGAIYARAHEAAAELLGGSSGREIVIGRSMTMLTFHMSRAIGRSLSPGDEIIVTRMDHEGNVAPWLQLAEERDLKIRWLPFNRDSCQIEPDDLKGLLTERTRLLALNYASNLTGSINPVAELARLAKQAGALVYVDAVQYVPHGKVEAAKLGCDFLACSSYKFFGPHLGLLWGREQILTELQPYAARCAPKELPGRHETGAPQTELFAGLVAAVDYLAWLGEQTGATGSRTDKLAHAYQAATAYEMPLARQLIEELGRIPLVQVHGITQANRMHQRVPTVSLTHPQHRSTVLARALANEGINVWSGHNYALETTRQLGLDEREGVLRIGLAHYNTADEVERVLSTLKKLLI